MNKIWEEIEKLESRDDIVEVHFADAAKIEKVKKLTNAVFATYKKVIGLYVGIENDSIYGMAYMILEDLSEGTLDRPTLYSIPVAVITRIRTINRTPIKTMGCVGFPFLAGKQVKVNIDDDGIGERDE